MWDELVEVLTTHDTFQVVQEVKALFISHLTVGVLGIHTLVVNDELGVFVIVAILRDRVLCLLLACDQTPHVLETLPRAFHPRIQEKWNSGSP